MRIAGILLTGGASRRLGFDKASALHAGTTLAARAAAELSAVCDPVIEVGTGVSGLAAVREDPPGAGPLAALLAGLDALGVDRALLLAVDLVGVRAPLLDLLASWPGEASVVPLDGGRAQTVCARYGPEATAQARTRFAAGERSLRWLQELAPGSVVEIGPDGWTRVAPADVFADVDTPADAARWRVVPGPPVGGGSPGDRP